MVLIIKYKDKFGKVEEYFASIGNTTPLNFYIEGVKLGMEIGECWLLSVRDRDSDTYYYKNLF